MLSVLSALDEVLREATQADQKATALRSLQGAVDVTDPTKAVQLDQVAAAHTQMEILAGDIPTGMGSLAVAMGWESLTPQQQQVELAEPILIIGLDGSPRR